MRSLEPAERCFKCHKVRIGYLPSRHILARDLPEGCCHGNFDGRHSPARLMTLGDHGCKRFPLCDRVEAMRRCRWVAKAERHERGGTKRSRTVEKIETKRCSPDQDRNPSIARSRFWASLPQRPYRLPMNRPWRSTQSIALAALLVALVFPDVTAAWETVHVSEAIPPGWIVINARKRSLFFINNEGIAIRYPIAVPKRGKEWAGEARVNGKYIRPDWVPPPDVKVDHPELPNFIRGGSPNNPMGARAITLDRFQVAIHGTTAKMRRSIGAAASYGCIRMLNEDVVNLFNRVSVGTPVLMIP
jgi:lipoprotein-anchoring transpeptidase ErfK/SrfK